MVDSRNHKKRNNWLENRKMRGLYRMDVVNKHEYANI